MGRYITKTDVDERWGESNVIIWSQRDSSATTADTARIDTCIAQAEEWLEAQFRGSDYSVPLVGITRAVPYQVIAWCATYAGIQLYRGRMRGKPTEGMTELLSDLTEEIAGYRNRTMGELDLQVTDNRTPEGPEVLT